ncbi:MAG: hypothetical protein FOGNACKC_05530 [Anaerolineae bacterium]|nr:hypothetical protein [Anaerolineae bacterium]
MAAVANWRLPMSIFLDVETDANTGLLHFLPPITAPGNYDLPAEAPF